MTERREATIGIRRCRGDHAHSTSVQLQAITVEGIVPTPACKWLWRGEQPVCKQEVSLLVRSGTEEKKGLNICADFIARQRPTERRRTAAATFCEHPSHRPGREGVKALAHILVPPFTAVAPLSRGVVLR